MTLDKFCSVTSKEGETWNVLSSASVEGSVASSMMDYSSKGSSLPPSVQAPSQMSTLQRCISSTGMDQPFSFRCSVLDAFDLDDLSSPRTLSLDKSSVKKVKSSLPKLNSFIFVSTQQNHNEPETHEIQQDSNTGKSLNGIDLHQKSFGLSYISHRQEENQMEKQLHQSSKTSEQNLPDNCFHLNRIKQDSNNDKHNKVSTDARCRENELLKVEKLQVHDHSASWSKAFWDGDHSLSASYYREQKNLDDESSAAIAIEQIENASQSKPFPPSGYAFENRTSSLGSTGSDIQCAINKQTSHMEMPFQTLGLKNLMDGNELVSNLQQSISRVSSNGQINTPTKMCGEQTNGLLRLKREQPILIQNTGLQRKKPRVEVDSQDSLSIPKGKIEWEDPRIRPGLTAANAVLYILYPQILFLLNFFIQVDQGSEKQVEVSELLDLELQSLAIQHKLPDHITAALFSTAFRNNTFSSDLPLIRHIHHDLLTQLQGMESKACNSIKETITRFSFLYFDASEAYHLKMRCLKALCSQYRSILLKSFRDNLLLQYSKETGSVYVLKSLSTEKPELSFITGQNKNFKVDQISATTSDDCKPRDASICDVTASTSIGLSYWTTNENTDLWSDVSQRKRLPKEACKFMDKYLLTNCGRIKREEKEAIARLLKLTFKQVEIYLSNARARKFKHVISHSYS